jgi:hypothetical protein
MAYVKDKKCHLNNFFNTNCFSYLHMAVEMSVSMNEFEST